jgi:hypothetical protein
VESAGNAGWIRITWTGCDIGIDAVRNPAANSQLRETAR